jgi:para-nitrobenzyl esterase
MAAKTLAAKEQDGVRLARSVGAGSLADLRALPADELLAAVMKTGGWGYSPGLDNHFLPQKVPAYYAAGEQAKIPLLAGWNSSELGMSIALNPDKPDVASFKVELLKQFGAKANSAAAVYPANDDDEAMQSAADLASDLFISYSTWKWIETHLATADAPVYRYRFDRVLPGDAASQFGAQHAVEIEYAFNTLRTKQSAWQPADFEIYFAVDTRSGPEEHRERYEFLDAMTID